MSTTQEEHYEDVIHIYMCIYTCIYIHVYLYIIYVHACTYICGDNFKSMTQEGSLMRK